MTTADENSSNTAPPTQPSASSTPSAHSPTPPDILSTPILARLDQQAKELLDAIYYERETIPPSINNYFQNIRAQYGDDPNSLPAQALEEVLDRLEELAAGQGVGQLLMKLDRATRRREEAVQAYYQTRKLLVDLGVL